MLASLSPNYFCPDTRVSGFYCSRTDSINNDILFARDSRSLLSIVKDSCIIVFFYRAYVMCTNCFIPTINNKNNINIRRDSAKISTLFLYEAVAMIPWHASLLSAVALCDTCKALNNRPAL